VLVLMNVRNDRRERLDDALTLLRQRLYHIPIRGGENLAEYVRECVQLSKDKFSQYIEEHLKLCKFVSISFVKTKEDLETQRIRLDQKVHDVFTSIDEKLDKLIEEFTLLQQGEIEAAQKRVFLERIEATRMTAEAKLLRDVKRFSHNVLFTSQSEVAFHSLDSNSQQYLKCEKAFHDNIHPDLPSSFTCLEVFSIFRLENQYLSKKFEVNT